MSGQPARRGRPLSSHNERGGCVGCQEATDRHAHHKADSHFRSSSQRVDVLKRLRVLRNPWPLSFDVHNSNDSAKLLRRALTDSLVLLEKLHRCARFSILRNLMLLSAPVAVNGKLQRIRLSAANKHLRWGRAARMLANKRSWVLNRR